MHAHLCTCSVALSSGVCAPVCVTVAFLACVYVTVCTSVWVTVHCPGGGGGSVLVFLAWGSAESLSLGWSALAGPVPLRQRLSILVVVGGEAW